MRTKSRVVNRKCVVSPHPPSFFTNPICSTTQDEYIGTMSKTSSDDCIHQNESVDLSDQNESVDLSGQNICLCCEQGGDVMVCSETACPITLHASCLGSEPRFDDLGKFYCPYCWYMRAVDKYEELREKSSTAKEDLPSLSDNRHDGTIYKCFRFGCERIFEAGEQVESLSASGLGTCANVQSQNVACDKGAEQTVACDKGAEQNVACDKGAGQNVACDKGAEQKVSSTGSPHTTSNYVRSRNQSFLAGRRTKLRWTVEEETALKEGFLKFSTKNEEVPWRTILAFGSGVFDKSRTPVDLKDKWRNITAKEGNGGTLLRRKEEKKERKSLLQEHNTADKNGSDINEEVASSRTSHTTSNYIRSRNQCFLAGRRTKLRWTVEEETALKEGFLKFSRKNEDVPWRTILAFGSGIFDKSRTPVDLKDKWRNITAKEGNGGTLLRRKEGCK